MGRWVRIDTAIFDHAAFALEQFSEREAWVWMIARAAWKDTKHKVGNAVMPVPVGSFYSTVREMQSAWRWKSTTKVVNFLKRLETEDMIEQETSSGKTQITICNYCRYQNVEDTENTPERQAKDSEKTLKTPEHQDTSSSLRSEGNKRATRLPDDWTLPASWGQWALSEGYDERVIRAEAPKFRDFWCSKGGKDATKVDWLATWRNWMRNVPKHSSQRAPPVSPIAQRQEAALKAFNLPRTTNHDEFAGDTIDLEPADFRSR